VGRRKAYDPDQVLDKAMNLFHRQGFRATTTEHLVEHLGINRFSLYSEFGSNKALFDRALSRFFDKAFLENFGSLEKPEAGLDEIRTLFKAFPKDAAGPASGVGCMLCNTSVELGGDDFESAKITNRYFKRLPKAFKNALDNANQAKLIKPDVDTKASSNFFATAVMGVMVLIRGKAPIAQVRLTSLGAISYLESISTQRR